VATIVHQESQEGRLSISIHQNDQPMTRFHKHVLTVPSETKFLTIAAASKAGHLLTILVEMSDRFLIIFHALHLVR